MNEFTSSLEDYIEALGFLSAELPEVRITDVALRLEVSKASASRAMTTLREAGYVEQRKYGALRLTGLGAEKAGEVAARHKLLEAFLSGVLGVQNETARLDACRMEHVMSAESIEKLQKYMENFKT